MIYMQTCPSDDISQILQLKGSHRKATWSLKAKYEHISSIVDSKTPVSPEKIPHFANVIFSASKVPQYNKWIKQKKNHQANLL